MYPEHDNDGDFTPHDIPGDEHGAGNEWFDEAVRRLHSARGFVARHQARRDRLVAAAAADIDAHFAPIIADAAARCGLLEDAIRLRMTDYLAATNRKSIKTPYGTVTTRTADKWVWPSDTTRLETVLAGIDADVFLRTKTVVELDRAAVKTAAVVKDGAVLIDGETLPDVTVTAATSVTVATIENGGL